MAREASKAVYDRNGDRRGVAYKRINGAEPAKTTYGVAVDRTGSPYRGAMDREINTPLGSIGYGYDGDTSYANVTPAFYANAVGGAEPTAWAGYNDWEARASRYNTPQGTTYGAGLNMPDNVSIPDFNKSFNTPFGQASVYSNDGNPGVFADFTPNQQTNAYLQALANLLSR